MLFKAKKIITTRLTTVSDAALREINAEINRAALEISPSGTNGRVGVFIMVVKSIFARFNVDEGSYWQRVFEKSPKKLTV